MNFARLNHILIPTTREERDAWRRGWVARLVRPLVWPYYAFSEEGRVLSLLCLFIGTASGEIGRTHVYLLWAILLGLLLASLVVRRAFALTKVRVEVSAPARVAVGKPITFRVTLVNEDDRPHTAVRIRAPFLPWDGRWRGAEPRFSVIEPGEAVHGEVQARFVARGHHHLDPFHACALVPLGMAMGPSLESGGSRFVVVPRIAPVESLRLPQGRSYQPGGVANASSTGEAMELMGVRPYRPGDPLRDLHAKTWARLGTPHIREYQQEYFSRIGVIVDTDAESLTEEGFEAAISLTAGVVARLTRGEALIDLLVLGEQIHSLTFGRALGNLDQALDVLACAEPGAKLAGDDLLTRLLPYLARLSCIVIVTQSTDPSRLALADAIERRGVACRVLRVHDDLGIRWLARRRPSIPPRGAAEVVVAASQIRAEEGLRL
ncbi:MAG: DUF58 domain-containing protein [Deltaproteobacteria bacterium]|nr:DUF58 domain-containing protein [Deltaproteobacteria bacterium]